MTESSDIIGKHVLAGLTYVTPDGDIIRREQKHGIIQSVDDDEGIRAVNPDSGEVLLLPPDPNCLEPASPGEYRLKSTGEVVIDPDFVCSWSIEEEPE